MILLVLLRVGILAWMTAAFIASLLQRTPLTFDANALYVSATWIAVAVIVAIAAFGFRSATQPARI